MRVWSVLATGLMVVAPLWAQLSLPPGDPVELILDDGTVEEGASIPDDVLIFNRFYPAEFPLELTEVHVLIELGGAMVGDPFYVFLYEDDDGVISNGTTHRATIPGVVQANDGTTFTEVAFDPVVFDGPGQILVVIGQDAVPGYGHTTDRTTPQIESWVVNWDGTFPPPIPSSGLGVSSVLNWMIRGFGTVLEVPVELQTFTVEP